MLLNSKEDCAANITRALERTSLWRKAMTVRWPDDPRNMRAVKKLDQLAPDAADLTEAPASGPVWGHFRLPGKSTMYE